MDGQNIEKRTGADFRGRAGALSFRYKMSETIFALVLAASSMAFFTVYRIPLLHSGDAAKYAYYMEHGELWGIPIHVTYIGTGVLFHWLAAPLHLSNLGPSLFTSAFFAGVGVGITYLLARGVCGLTLPFALLSAALLAFSRTYMFYGGVVQYGSAQAAAFLCAFLALSLRRPWLAGCALAFCTLVTPATVLCYPPLLLFVLLSRRWKEAIVFTCVCGAIALAVSLVEFEEYYFSARGLFPASATGRAQTSASLAKVLVAAHSFWIGWKWYILLVFAGVYPLFRRNPAFALAALLLVFTHFAYFAGYIFKPVFYVSLCPVLALFAGAALQEVFRFADTLELLRGRWLGRLAVVVLTLMALTSLLNVGRANQHSRHLVKQRDMLELNEVGSLLGPGDKLVGSFSDILPWAYAAFGNPYAKQRGQILYAVENNREGDLYVHGKSMETMQEFCRQRGVEMRVRKTGGRGYTYGFIPKGAFHGQSSPP